MPIETLTLEILALIVAIAAVVVALFQEWLRAKLFPPRLSLSLLSDKGYPADVDLDWSDEYGAHHKRKEKARFYHLVVRNTRRWSKAHQVQVFLVKVEVPGNGGTVLEQWTGDIPLRWRYQESNPVVRTIGPDAQCDLFNVVRGKWLELCPLFRPEELPGRWKGGVTIRLTLQLRSLELDLSPMTIHVAWDGEWDDGEAEMKRHVAIQVL